MSSLHPWSWLTVFQCGVLERVAISCCVAMHVPLRSKLNCLSNKAPRRLLFYFLFFLLFFFSTEDQLPCRTKRKASYVSNQFLFPISTVSPSPLLACLDFLFSPNVTAQVPVLLLFKNIVFCFWGFYFCLFYYYYLNCYSYVYLST